MAKWFGMRKGVFIEMKIRTIGYFFRQAFTSLSRNMWMSIAAVATIAITLFIVGLITLLVVNAELIAGALESEVEIVAFLEVDVSEHQAIAVGEQIKKIRGVDTVELVTKEEGLAMLNQRFGSEHDLLAALGGVNPLPHLYRVKAQAPEYVESIAKTLTQVQHVEKVDYGQGVVEKLFTVVYWVRLLGLGLVVLLSLGAIYLVSTTIRLAVFARRREINIMKYVGATDWFIRWPFFIEGMVLGCIGGLLAVGFLYGTYDVVLFNFSQSLPFIPLLMDMNVIMKILASLVAAGTLVGALGSLISVRRFLQV